MGKWQCPRCDQYAVQAIAESVDQEAEAERSVAAKKAAELESATLLGDEAHSDTEGEAMLTEAEAGAAAQPQGVSGSEHVHAAVTSVPVDPSSEHHLSPAASGDIGCCVSCRATCDLGSELCVSCTTAAAVTSFDHSPPADMEVGDGDGLFDLASDSRTLASPDAVGPSEALTTIATTTATTTTTTTYLLLTTIILTATYYCVLLLNTPHYYLLLLTTTCYYLLLTTSFSTF